MKISFPNCGSGVGISIRAAINALLNWHNAERAPTTARQKNVPQTTGGWNYRPREAIRRFAVVQSAETETAELHTAEKTIKGHRGRVMQKLGVPSVA